ncbi:Signal transduction histidine kinase [Lachnospiraceae bacterium RM5]|nr:Signal transduction histidine kinase [Lachnospiraceae bacterium RM5]
MFDNDENMLNNTEKKGIFKRFLLWLKMVSKSLRIRIGLVIIIIGIVIPLLTCLYLYGEIENSMIDMKMDRLLSQSNILKNNILKEGYLESRESEAINAELAQLSAMYDGRVLIIDSDFKIIKDTYVMDEGKNVISRNVILSFQGNNISIYRKNENYIEISLPIMNEKKKTIGVLYAEFSTNDIKYSMENIKKNMKMIVEFTSIVFIIFGIIISRLFVKPLKKVKESFEKINYGYVDFDKKIDSYTEMEDMFDSVNESLKRMKKIDDSRQEFVSNVSHELKTPMTSIKVLADSLAGQENVPAEIYKDFFEDITKEIDRENDIISNLLALVRTEKNNAVLNIAPTNINDMMEGILKIVRPIASQKNIELVLESFRPIEAEVDEMKLASAMTNLVENAVKYNVVDGWVRVTLNADHQYFYIKVADSGVGIPEDSIDLVFERFYRVDKDRARKSGGTGLGLAITKNIIVLHNGEIKVYSKEGEGTTFNVRIPLTYVSN